MIFGESPTWGLEGNLSRERGIKRYTFAEFFWVLWIFNYHKIFLFHSVGINYVFVLWPTQEIASLEKYVEEIENLYKHIKCLIADIFLC